MGLTVRAGGATDVGLVRANNQDSFLVTEALFAVADGMGGHAGGEIASQVALTTLEHEFTERSTDGLVDAVEAANEAVLERSLDDPDLSGMGTTLCAAAVVTDDDGEEHLGLVNVGDSRIYWFHGQELEQLSHDHKLVQEMVDAGEISADEAAEHPQRNILTRALGLASNLPVDRWVVSPLAGDRFLLCSDGLYEEVGDGAIAAALRRLEDPTEAAEELVRLANTEGGSDNITVVIVDVVDDDGRLAAATEALAESPSPRHRPTVKADPDPDPDSDGAAAELGDDEIEAGRRRPRTALVTVLLAGLIVLVALGGAGWYARSGWFVAFDGDRVAIFQGRPGGVLWWDATLEERTGLTRDDVPPARLAQLDDGKEQSSLDEARIYVDRLREEGQQLERQAGATTTSTPAGPDGPSTTATPER